MRKRLEDTSKKKSNWTKTKQAVLSVVAMGGLVTVSAVAPGAVTLLKTTATGRRLANKLFYTRAVFSQMIEEGYIELSANRHPRLTKKGEQKLRSLGLEYFKINKPRRWDGKWRMLVFDIKETRRIVRENLRRSLMRIGFEKMQNSVWVYPYDCEEIVVLLKADFKIGKEVLYVIADQIENDLWLREKFNLPLGR